MKKVSILWFKKNLRISDNSALYKASKEQKIAAIYINDPDIINNDDFSYYHFQYTYYLTQDSFSFGVGQFNHGFRTPSSIFYLN